MKRVRKSLKQVISELPKYYSSPEIKLGLADNIKFDFVKDIFGKELKDMFKDAKFIEIDGVRADTDTEMVIIRASQNGPYVTIKFEGKTEDQYNQLKSKLKVMLKSHREVDWTYGVNTDAFD